MNFKQIVKRKTRIGVNLINLKFQLIKMSMDYLNIRSLTMTILFKY